MFAVAKVHNGIIGKVFPVRDFDDGVSEILKIVISEFKSKEDKSLEYQEQHIEQLGILGNQGIYEDDSDYDNVWSYQVIEI